ncbi:MAG: hybrid sensor histidine kinase/response regulator [Alphaproteobacteria bacterium]|nr:hybrid sensor histidine kinase/response regulator [Alphaproteobacteria bacterium]
MRLAHRLALRFSGAVTTAIRRARCFGAFARETLRPGFGAGRPRTGLIGPDPSAGGGPGAALAGRPRRGLNWPLRLLLAASLAVPLLLLAAAAWQNFRLVQVQAEQRVRIGAGQLHEHVVSAMETYALVLAWIDDRIRGLDWDQIEHDEGLHRFLSDIEALPQIGVVSIIDAQGRVRASGDSIRPAFADASGRGAFVAQKERDAGIFIGLEHTNQRMGVSDFDISRRRSTPDGRFDGVIVVSASRDYFSDFFRTASRGEDFSASMMRSDGTVLMRYPNVPGPLVFSPDTRVMQAIATKPDRGSFWGTGSVDGIGRLFGYQRVGGYPLYVVFGIPTRAMLTSWWATLVNYLLFAIPASLGLFYMTLFAVRQLQQQRIASWRWQTTARRLKREMTRRNQAEAALHQAQKMEALGQLTGGVAHDFNNLLTVLQGCMEVLSGRQEDERLQARVDMALATIERAEKLTGQLLAFGRRQPLTVARVELNELLHGMAELLGRTVGSDVRIVTDFARDLWPVDADATQLELAMINLAINARDAMPAGGVLRVRTFNTNLPRRPPREELGEGGDFVGLEISDTGTGMPPEILARAFEPFFTTKGPAKGTGLGLSMVYGFARQSGGSAAIRSEVGAGTAVTLLLPRAKGHMAEEEDARVLPPAGSA